MNSSRPRHRSPLFLALVIILLHVGFSSSIGHSQEYTNGSGDPAWLTGESIQVTIAYYNRQIYYVNSPIWVEVRIANHGFTPFLFHDADIKLFTYDFQVLTRENRPVEHSRRYQVDFHHHQPVLYKEITLKHNEVYAVRIDISRWFDLDRPGEYVIRGVFYPLLNTGAAADERIRSHNQLDLRLNPPYSEEVRRREKQEELARLQAEYLPPYQVVETVLKALQEKDFETFFLYVKFDRFIQQFKNSWRRYQEARDVDKPAVIQEFKGYLRGLNQLEPMPFSEFIPTGFEIQRTVIDNQKRDAEVTVLQTHRYGNLEEQKRYVYHLHRYGDLWMLVSYAVQNL
ncbi:MAG: hypothetical protein ACOC8N_06435 [Spirochaetota bacterium]